MREEPSAHGPSEQLDRIIADEPFGHDGYFSKFERAWQAAPPGSAMTRTRTQRFDTNSSLLYSPVVYQYDELGPSIEVPDADWIHDAFCNFVRGEFGTGGGRSQPSPVMPTIVGHGVVGFDVFESYLESCESELVYGSVVRSVQEASRGDMVEDVLRLLHHQLIGHKANARNLEPKTFRSQVESQVARKDRLLFVVPACPFKDQNALRTLGGPAYPDAGELAFLINLHTLALALYQVHPFGADCVILADGELYASIFGVTTEDSVRYRERLRTFRNRLNLQGTVSILDLKEVIGNFTQAVGADVVEAVLDQIRKVLRGLENVQGDAGEAFHALTRGMRWNLSSRHLLADHSPETMWMILTASEETELDSSLVALWRELQDRAVKAAVEYGALNLMMRHFNLIPKLFPGCIRATVHPKPGQLAVRAIGSSYPWNGVAFRNGQAVTPVMFESHPLYELAREESLRPVRLEGYSDDAPFYFEKA